MPTTNCREEGSGSRLVGWLDALAKRVGADNVWEWIASRTQIVIDKTGEITDSISDWDVLAEFDAGAIGESVAPRRCD